MVVENAFGIIVVGDEILTGRRQDRHFDVIGGMLRQRGFAVAWLRLLPDDPDYLAAELGRTMSGDRPVFCCGGIGATPDDHTRSCAASAAGVPLELHAGAVAEIEARFGDDAYPNRIRMAELPKGCELIPNPYNRIPGFSIKGHYFVPGFPDMAHPMAEWVMDSHYAEGGRPEHERAVRVIGVTESSLMELMESLTKQFPDAKLFSLPRLGAEFQIEIGFRGRSDLDGPMDVLTAGLDRLGITYDRIHD